ncbi:DUF2786 domain-containing protein [Pseudomonas sp. DSP3-2-2]|uniref:DUF2786 domain-containing protein n=1 Tax=unclassified Pseudomonas TaxID=196821 RepID=UPI003CE98D27
MDYSKAVDKIKKLLRLAASDNPHEAAAAMRQARSLMEKFRIEAVDVALSDIQESASRSGSKVNPVSWEANLAGCVKRAYSCEFLFMAGIGEWRFIGEFAEVASYTMTVLLRQLRKARQGFISEKLSRCKASTKTKRADVFCDAWVYQVRKEVMAFAGSAVPSPAAAAYMLRHHPDTTQSKPLHRNSGKQLSNRTVTDAMHGILAASDVRLNHGVGGRDQALLN